MDDYVAGLHDTEDGVFLGAGGTLVDGNQRSRRAKVQLKFFHLLGACF